MTAEQQGKWATLLTSKRDDTLEYAERLRASLGIAREARADATADDEHDPEGPTMSQEWTQLTALLADAESEIDDVDAALARIDAGSYGICTSCGKPITKARLQARPTAELCIDCARLGR
ncbi:TraR/DksA family transcriptional regulator [Agromyces archimandritae]|uniref:TraR/DksA C4-type zinc finger protein n=1 Tax=Agromyces archimandritae TaxID=2781962 RepID=A0A975FMT2_9MICO|nr:TraR/DksA C4-type zinc finger protein [Agromyces archimandritae]QTX03886.1 TraR/DksA C4-type zinc finger protein [Agromyces archimandritae]